MIEHNDLPLLSLLLLTLPVGALLVWLVPGPRKARWIALATLAVDLVLTVVIGSRFDPAVAGFQLVEQASWIPSLNVHYRVGVDGISVLFLPLTILLVLGVVAGSWSSVRTMPRLYYSLLLLLESVTLGVFCALDTVLFFLFWELSLIPLYFLISLWGIGPDRRYAAVKYTLFMLVGGVPLLFAFLVLAFNHAEFSGAALPGGLVFDYVELLGTPLSHSTETLVFLLLLAAFFFLFALASLGVPGTAGFPAEFLILMSTLKSHTGAGLAALFGMVLGATYMLDSYRRTFYGPVGNGVVAAALDLRRRELLVTLVFAALILLAGLYPAVVLDVTREAGTLWAGRLEPPP